MMNPGNQPSQTMPNAMYPGNRPPQTAPENQKRGASGRKKALAAFVLLVCIIGGGFLIVQAGRSSSQSTGNTGNISTPTLTKPWCAAPTSLSTDFSGTSISGLAANDVWSVGPKVMHWNGDVWNVAYNSSSPQDVFRSIVEIAPNNVWVVGEHVSNGLPSHSLTLHWDGINWQQVASPDAVAGGKNALVAVSASSAHDVWAVGFSVPQRGAIEPVIEHWDGTKWSVSPGLSTLGSAQFTGVKALSADDAWAVGYGYSASSHAGQGTTQPVIVHWDGKQWKAVTNPNLSVQGGGSLYNIDGSSANDLWAVGSSKNQMLTEHWDGQSWSVIASPSVYPDSSNWLASVAASAPNNVWAVGRVRSSESEFQPFIEHWDGHQWQVMQDPFQDAGELDSVLAVGHQFWVVGLPRTSGGHAFIETLCP
ncbi:MAG TPA: hypothetical protein VKV19_14905 [Ktedonobacteraceae bacterium]|nr:hypothetical protein [Ktedonobacteraceae bacterium]